MAFFFFGTLMDPDVLACVLDRPLEPDETVAAQLAGFRRVRAEHAPYPVLVPASSAKVDGRLLVEPGRRDERRIAWFEEDEYVERWHEVTVAASGRRCRARLFVALDLLGATAEPWDIGRFVERDKATYLDQCEVWMRDCPV